MGANLVSLARIQLVGSCVVDAVKIIPEYNSCLWGRYAGEEKKIVAGCYIATSHVLIRSRCPYIRYHVLSIKKRHELKISLFQITMSQKLHKSGPKSSKGKAASTSIISQPSVEDTSNLAALSSFSADGTLFAFLSLAVDKHRLRVFNTASAQSVAEFTVDSARVSYLTWTCLNLSVDGGIPPPDDSTIQPSKKKRKKRNSTVKAGEQISGTQVVVLGLTNGVVLFFSPTHGRVLRALSHPASSSPILCVVFATEGDTSFVWVSAADATLHLWHFQKNEFLYRWKNDDRVAYSSMAVRYTADAGQAEVLFARYSMRLLSSTYSKVDLSKQKQVASFTGHASPIQLIRWDNAKAPSEQFMSMAEGDRFIYIWKVADGVSSEGSPAASIALDSDARTFSVTGSTATVERHTLATLSASGKVSIFPLPDELPSPVSTGATPHKIPTLLPRSIISSSGASIAVTPVVAVTLDRCDEGSVRVARLVNGVRPIFDLVVGFY